MGKKQKFFISWSYVNHILRNCRGLFLSGMAGALDGVLYGGSSDTFWYKGDAAHAGGPFSPSAPFASGAFDDGVLVLSELLLSVLSRQMRLACVPQREGQVFKAGHSTFMDWERCADWLCVGVLCKPNSGVGNFKNFLKKFFSNI